MYGHNLFLTRMTARWRLVGLSLRHQFGRRRRPPSSWGVRKSRKGAGWLWLFVLLGMMFMSLWSFQQLDRKLSPIISRLATIQAQQIAVETINEVIQEKIVNNSEYQNLMVIHKDKENRPVLIEPNVMKIQKMQSTAMREVNKALQQMPSKKFSIPMGMLLDSNLLADTGPDIEVSFRPTGIVDLEVINDFQEAGINQTRQIISLKITTDMAVVAPLLKDTTKVTTVVKVADNIIIGQTPSVLFNK